MHPLLPVGRAPAVPSGPANAEVDVAPEGEGSPLEKFRSDLPNGLIPVLGAMMEKKPKDRIQRAEEVAGALAPFCQKSSIAPPTEPAPPECVLASPDTKRSAPLPDKPRPSSKAQAL